MQKKNKKKTKKKNEKEYLVPEIIACEMAAVNRLYYEGNTCHGQSVPSETVLRPNI